MMMDAPLRSLRERAGLLAKGFDAIMLILMRKAKHVLVTRSRALASFTSEAKGV